VAGWFYRHVGSHFFFLFDSEPIHDFFLDLGEVMGRVPGIPALTAACFRIRHPSLKTTVAGITFENPVGLAAGFDHEAQLPRIIGAIGFGFESVGTITNGSYSGNPYPRIKRLVNSRAILVNKGFKSTGIDAVLKRLAGSRWPIPIGISLGRTNTTSHESHADAIADVVAAFQKTIAADLPFSYLELNISCPNLLKDISFYEPEKLEEMLGAVCALKLPKPLFIKMPIVLSDEKTLALLDVIVRYPVAAVIFGNLQHDRSHPAFDQKEISAFTGIKGNWSGMPCQNRSDELVRLTYRHVGDKLAIVGCGGIFTAEDAYRKVLFGASLVQLAAATIFEGPQIASEINLELPKLLKRDGFVSIKDAVGAAAR
jgi:dihydroorotate dehydrogenase subfamily 2